MPFAFPSHQGLIAPLWRLKPAWFDIPALFIGAAMPDVVDGTIGVFRGHLGQGLGHSLIALPLLCIPGGLALWWLSRTVARPWNAWKRSGFLARAWNAGLESVHASPAPGTRTHQAARVVISLGLGAFSHLFFDLISHGGFTWFYPWTPKIKLFPAWWYTTWYRLPLPGYNEPYPIGPHFIMWVFLGILGIILLFYPYLRKQYRNS
ncbi:MAG: hypothetical protein BWX80_02989 [Candidatus Hydrogenedentes bacterium ADurb.Bin101]|jgi:hypothetical protein|nr:MAG: hypothetical protein BWX80_02989 [Candidatus Hydrogenedentes bacterium ADurb.Bin101]HOC71067.1 DUF4184 family protein [Candidatus Hydrogenedentota bacterium]